MTSTARDRVATGIVLTLTATLLVCAGFGINAEIRATDARDATANELRDVEGELDTERREAAGTEEKTADVLEELTRLREETASTEGFLK